MEQRKPHGLIIWVDEGICAILHATKREHGQASSSKSQNFFQDCRTHDLHGGNFGIYLNMQIEGRDKDGKRTIHVKLRLLNRKQNDA